MKEMADLRVRSAITLEECRCVLLKHADLKILSSDWDGLSVYDLL